MIRNQMVYLIESYKQGLHEFREFFQAWDILDSSLRRSITQLESSVMSMRMMSVQTLFSRMSRVVQAYTSSSNKKIQLQTRGETTELDKKVLDALGDPLIHLIRNAMDHGIEENSERLKQSKPETGTITLSASIIGNEAVVTIEDDGKGIDPKRVLESAKKKNIDVSHVQDDRSAIELIFLPGFSTAEKVSDVSGRGVGMDAVRTSVQALGGSILINTKFEVGTTFTIKIPVSMSMIPVIQANINGYNYAIPNREVLETRQTSFDQVQYNAGKDHIQFRGTAIPCVDLRKTIQAAAADHEESVRECAIIFFNDESGRKTAARVSSLSRTTEIISKPLSPLSPKIPWVTGISVLPTGEPIFIISLRSIYSKALEVNGSVSYVA